MEGAAERPRVAFKSCPSDFVVEEDLDLTFAGEGEHGYFFVEKCERNTADVVRALTRALDCRDVDVGYAGLKDKHAVTRQWFSIRGVSAWPQLDDPAIRCLTSARHTRKLRRGMHRGNRFQVTLRNVPAGTDERLRGLMAGFANYFGAQRVNPSNCQAARQWLGSRRRGQGRRGRGAGRAGWHLSVLRSELFNAVLAHRAGRGDFPAPLPGDVLQEGVPTGPLWGRGRSATAGTALCLEQQALAPYAAICEQLEYAGVDQARRPLWVTPQHLKVEAAADMCELTFTLPPGAYATALLEQAVVLEEPGRG